MQQGKVDGWAADASERWLVDASGKVERRLF